AWAAVVSIRREPPGSPPDSDRGSPSLIPLTSIAKQFRMVITRCGAGTWPLVPELIGDSASRHVSSLPPHLIQVPIIPAVSRDKHHLHRLGLRERSGCLAYGPLEPELGAIVGEDGVEVIEPGLGQGLDRLQDLD